MSVELCYLNGGPYYHPQIQIHESKFHLMVRRIFAFAYMCSLIFRIDYRISLLLQLAASKRTVKEVRKKM